MKCNKKALASALTIAIGATAYASAASAVTLTFTNNASATAATGTQLVGFTANTEFHVITTGGTGINDTQKDVMSGGETWTFNGNTAGSSMTAVSGTGGNAGAGMGTATLTTGVAGFPIAGAPNTVASIQNGATFLQTNALFTMGAPTLGSILGNAFGAATINDGTTAGFTQAGTFTVNMPVVFTQWANGTYIIGGDPNANPAHGDKCGALTAGVGAGCGGAGVDFNGTADGSGNFTMWATQKMTKDEVTVLGFNGNTTEWAFTGTYEATTVVPVPAAVWLFGSGLVGLASVARRRRKDS